MYQLANIYSIPFPADRNFNGQNKYWAAVVMEILIFTSVNVCYHMTGCYSY